MTLSDAEIEQRRKAGQGSTIHGAYAFRDRGEQALEPRQRSRLVELREQVQSPEGVRELLADRAANAVMVVEIITAHVAQEHKAGKPLERISILRALPAFMNTAQRALRDLLAVMPDESKILDLATTVKNVMSEGIDDS